MDTKTPEPLPRFQNTRLKQYARFVRLDENTSRIDGALASYIRIHFRGTGEINLVTSMTDGNYAVLLRDGERDLVTYESDVTAESVTDLAAALDLKDDESTAVALALGDALELFMDLAEVYGR